MALAAEAALDAVQERVLDSLRRDGIALVPFGELLDDDGFWDALCADIGEFVRETEPRAGELLARDDRKAYIVNRFPTKTRFALDGLWFRLGLSSRVLDVVNAYRGEATKLVALNNWYTIPNASSEAR